VFPQKTSSTLREYRKMDMYCNYFSEDLMIPFGMMEKDLKEYDRNVHRRIVDINFNNHGKMGHGIIKCAENRNTSVAASLTEVTRFTPYQKIDSSTYTHMRMQ